MGNGINSVMPHPERKKRITFRWKEVMEAVLTSIWRAFADKCILANISTELERHPMEAGGLPVNLQSDENNIAAVILTLSSRAHAAVTCCTKSFLELARHSSFFCSMWASVQLIGAHFFSFLLRKLSRDFKRRGMSILYKIQTAIYPYSLRLQSRGPACWYSYMYCVCWCDLDGWPDPRSRSRSGGFCSSENCTFLGLSPPWQ